MKKLTGRIFQRLPPEQYDGYMRQIYQSNYTPALAIAAMVVLFEAFMLLAGFFRQGSPFESPTRLTYMILYSLLLVATLVCIVVLLVSRRNVDTRPRSFATICYTYAWIICLWASYLSAFSHSHGSDDISVFLYVSLCIAVFVPMHLAQASALFVANQVVLILLTMQFMPDGGSLYSLVINTSIVSLLSIFIASSLSYSRVRAFLNSVTISEQRDEIQSINERLEAMVITDELTRIHNRRYLQRDMPAVVDIAREAGRPLSVLMLDVDYFKHYNDVYGHQAGDECLRRVTNLVNQVLTQEGGYLARYGGEEFVAVLVGYSPEVVLDMAEDMRTRISRAAIAHAGTQNERVTVSIGVCHSPPGGNASMEQLIRYADEALYRAKDAGRDKTMVYQSKDSPDDYLECATGE